MNPLPQPTTSGNLATTAKLISLANRIRLGQRELENRAIARGVRITLQRLEQQNKR